MSASPPENIANWEEELDRSLGVGSDTGQRRTAILPWTESLAPDGESELRGPVPLRLPPPDDTQIISVDKLRFNLAQSIRAGMSLSADIYDESGVLLLNAGTLITQRFMQLLRDRRIQRIRLHYADADRRLPDTDRPWAPPLHLIEPEDTEHTVQSRQLDDLLAGELQRPIALRPVRAWRRPFMPLETMRAYAQRGVERHSATRAVMAEVSAALSVGRPTHASELRATVTSFVDMAAADYDLLPTIIALQQPGEEYLFDHCVNCALLGMAVGLQLGIDREHIMTLGLGGLLHDIGMLRVPRDIRLAPRSLTERERQIVGRHPLHTLDMLTELRGLPVAVRIIAYQNHERADGSGYPRRRLARQLLRLSKIMAIADQFTAMVRPRPYRPAHSAYEAARTVLNDAADQKFEAPLIRAFLDTVALFPTGSLVQLSSGVLARVIRAIPGLAARPTVEELTSDGIPTGHVIRLADESSLRVIHAL